MFQLLFKLHFACPLSVLVHTQIVTDNTIKEQYTRSGTEESSVSDKEEVSYIRVW